jgi:lipopolysaccharide biosynthesis glycosyltransferase
MTVKILFTCDNKYFKPMALCALSIRGNLPPRSRLKVYLLHKGIPRLRIALLKAWFRIRRIDLVASEPDFSERLKRFPLTYHFTEQMYYRILAPLCLAEERVIYLDPDIIALGSIAELWALDLGDATCAAVAESQTPEHKAEIGLIRDAAYFNSGVLLLNLSRLRGRIDELLSWIAANSAKVLWPDQDALNAVLAEDWLPLDPKWNRRSDRYRESEDDAMILHYAGSSKPWHKSSDDRYRRNYLREMRRYFPLDFALLVMKRWASEIKKSIRRTVRRLSAQ